MQQAPIVRNDSIAVVIPSYKVRAHILDVIARIGPEVHMIFVVDDACPDQSGAFVEENCDDLRVRVIKSEKNQGVGGATLTGMSHALDAGADIIVKVDGDGQMEPAFIPNFCAPILAGDADYTKGNRFFDPESLAAMPKGRFIGNLGLSFLAKLSSGYWTIMDPTNGYFAMHRSVANLIPSNKVAHRFFFESDLLFRLNVIGARILDVPMYAHYGDEVSNLNPVREIPKFAASHLRNLGKRIAYNYFMRDFNIASFELMLGLLATTFGVVFGLLNWRGPEPATAGTVMLAALPVIVGIQFLISFINYDIRSEPTTALHPRLGDLEALRKPLKKIEKAEGET